MDTDTENSGETILELVGRMDLWIESDKTDKREDENQRILTRVIAHRTKTHYDQAM